MHDEENNSKEFGSNSSVLNLSLDISNYNKDKNDNYSDSCSNSSFDIPKCLSKKIILKKEKEESDFNTSNFGFFQTKNKDNNDESNITRKRSKTDYIPMCLINNAPKIKPKECNDKIISPLNLCMKSFFQDYSHPKKISNILYDFQKNLIDCKSCNDNFSDNEIFSDDTERTTPNVNDLNNFSICRKKMKNIITNSKVKSSYEYENILSSDCYFQSESEFTNINHNSNKNKKNNFWHKHIVKQKLKSKEKYKDKDKSENKNKQIGYNKSKTFNLNEQKIIDTQGLFILGVLESAAKEKKKRITTGNCC